MVNPNAASLAPAVLGYFAGERQEMVIILFGAASSIGLSLWLWSANKGEFAVTFAGAVVVFSLLLSAMAVSLLVRDAPLAKTVSKGVSGSSPTIAIMAEQERVQVIVSKYRYYRYAAGLLGVVASLAIVLSTRSWVHGIATAVFIVIAAQVLVDYYSELRATQYLHKLRSFSTTQADT